MSFGWSAGDVFQAASLVWDIYQCIADGARNAKADFTQFKEEFVWMTATIAQLQEAEKDVPVSKRISLPPSYQRTIDQCKEFVERHKRLANDIHPGGAKEAFQWHTVPERVVTLFHQVSWPMEREKAERLRRLLERNVKLATLMATTTVIDIQKHNRQESREENMEILREVQNMSVYIQLFLRLCLAGHGPRNGDNTLESGLLSELGLRPLPRLRDREQSLLDFPTASSDERTSMPLPRIRQVSEKLEYHVKRRDMPAGFLDEIRADIRGALTQAGFKHITVPNQLTLNAPAKPKEPDRILNKELDEWEKFSDWVKFVLQHQQSAITPAQRERSPAHNDPEDEPPPTPVVEQPINPGYRCTKVETQYPVKILFPDPNKKNHELNKPVECTISVYHDYGTRDVGFIEATDLSGTVKITHRINQETFKGPQSSMIPYIQSAHVGKAPKSPFRISFQGSHRVKIESNGAVERYAISPVYVCQKQDFGPFQRILLGREVLYCGDVNYIEADGAEHCSLETIRVLQDPITSMRSLLYFGRLNQGSKPSNAQMGFLEWPLHGFVEVKYSKLSTKLQLQGEAIARRNSLASNGSMMSSDSHHSLTSLSSAGHHITHLAIYFHDAKDCENFRKALRPGEGQQ